MKSIIFLPLFLFSATVFSQKMEYKGFPSVVWPTLYNIDFETGKDNLGEFRRPLFGKAVRSLEGKEVTLPGYLVPFDKGMKAKQFMLSSLPLNACFFCGVGGPETVVEVATLQDVTYTEKPVEITGILRLNDKDPDKMIYTLERARFVGEIDF